MKTGFSHIFILAAASFLFLCFRAECQTTESSMGYRIVNGDTLYIDKIKPLFFFGHPSGWEKTRKWRKYRRTVYNFGKTYPYAILARKISMEADSTIAAKHFNRFEREKYIRKTQKELFRKFEKPLKNMTVSQGKMLLKLIDRELGRTSFSVIKGYKGGVAAGFWQGIARLFGSDLKEPYDMYGRDRILEELVITYQEGAFNNLYFSMFGSFPKYRLSSLSPSNTR
ncbi:MAG: DUF4294 domain-containing protein [Bacteroidales bacterium]|jgi:hypothetical protein|nr:DUF4294 domain-containing protein [Bacteroidales bacterium]